MGGTHSLEGNDTPLGVLEMDRWPEDPALAPGTVPGQERSFRRQ